MDQATIRAQQRRVKELLESKQLIRDHLAYTRRMFIEAEGSPFDVRPHHKVVCDQFDKVFKGECKRLIVNIPPGYSKTELGVINFVGRGFAYNPKSRFIHTSYSEKLVFDNSSRIKSHIQLPAYQRRWPVTFKSDTQAKGLWRTNKGGHFLASPAGGPITGFRAGYLNARNLPDDISHLEDYELDNMQDDSVFTGAFLIDDPLKPDDALSEPTRTKINERWENTFRSRLAHKDVPVIVIMQRLHVDDFAAHLLANSGETWDVITIPVFIDPDEKPFDLGPNANVIDHGLPPGPLWPAKADVAEIEVLKKDKSTYHSQYLQRPIVIGGNVFKEEHFAEFDPKERPDLKRRLIIGDTASKTEERHDYSVFGCFGLDAENRLYLLDMVRGKWEAPELVQIATKFYEKHQALPWNVHGTLMGCRIEDKSSGIALIQTMKRNKFPVSGVQVEKDKYTKALGVIPTMAVNPLLLPKDAPWKDDFMSELLAFPEGVNDDQCDVVMMGVMEMLHKGPSMYENL